MIRRVNRARLILPLALVALHPFARAAGALDPQGVYIDADGVLRSRTVADSERLRAIRRAAGEGRLEPQLTYVSLPRLLAEARGHLAAGRDIPDDVRFLGGLVEIRYAFLFPQERDVVIAGPAEPIVRDFPSRPVGGITGRPLLQLDDVIIALRTCGPGRPPAAFGCNIVLSREATEAMVRAFNERRDVVVREPDRRGEVARAMAQAAGMQPVEFYEIAPETRFAFVLVEADYLLKRQALGLDPAPVRRLRSYLDRANSTTPLSHGFWFEIRPESVRATPERDALGFDGPVLRVGTRRRFHEADDDPVPAARTYAKDATRHMAALEGAIPAFADLDNLARLALVAAWIARENIADTINWDLSWWLDRYAVPRVATPREAETLANYRVGSGGVFFVAGGVRLDPSRVLSSSAVLGEDDITIPRARPSDSNWRAGGHGH
jgi:hypothetical protein